MKEAEAKRKICPQLSSKSTYEYCKGSECMMWESWEQVMRSGPTLNPGQGDCTLKQKDSE